MPGPARPRKSARIGLTALLSRCGHQADRHRPGAVGHAKAFHRLNVRIRLAGGIVKIMGLPVHDRYGHDSEKGASARVWHRVRERSGRLRGRSGRETRAARPRRVSLLPAAGFNDQAPQ
jgi:hypothetical protein